MAEYIDREAVLAEIYQYTRHYWPTVSYVESIIKEQPAADVEPVRHGRWIWHEEAFEYECPDCHCRFDYDKTYELFDHGFQFANYCPYCGAKMDGGVEDAAD